MIKIEAGNRLAAKSSGDEPDPIVEEAADLISQLEGAFTSIKDTMESMVDRMTGMDSNYFNETSPKVFKPVIPKLQKMLADITGIEKQVSKIDTAHKAVTTKIWG